MQERWWPSAAPCPGFFKELRAVSVVSWEPGKRHKEVEQLFRSPLQPYPAQQCLWIRPEEVAAPQGCPILQEGRGMRRCSLPFSAPLPCSASGVVKKVRILGRETKGWYGFLKLLQKSLLMKAQGKGLFSHSQHRGRFAAGLLHSCVWASPSLTRGLGTRHLSSSSLL